MSVFTRKLLDDDFLHSHGGARGQGKEQRAADDLGKPEREAGFHRSQDWKMQGG
jgi:hypothetical protein